MILIKLTTDVVVSGKNSSPFHFYYIYLFAPLHFVPTVNASLDFQARKCADVHTGRNDLQICTLAVFYTNI